MLTNHGLRLTLISAFSICLLLASPLAQAEAEEKGSEPTASEASQTRENGLEASAPEALQVLAVDRIKSQIEELKAVSVPAGDTKVALELYQTALVRLRRAERDEATVAGYQKTIDEMIGQKAEIKTQLEQLEAATRKQTPIADDLDLRQLEQQLDQLQAERRLAQNRLTELRASITNERLRPARVIDELAEIKAKLEDVKYDLRSKIVVEGGDIRDQALKVSLQAARLAIKSQINRLEMERLSHAPRMDLMALQENLLQTQLAQVAGRVKPLQQVLNAKRVKAAAEAARQAVEVKRGTSGKPQLLQTEATKNTELGSRLKQMTADLARTSREKELLDNRLQLLGRNMERARQQLDIAGFEESLGEILRTQRKELPNLKLLERRKTDTSRRIVEIRLEQFRLEDRLQNLLDDTTVTRLLNDSTLTVVGIWQRAQLQRELKTLLQDRVELLQRLQEIYGRYAKALGDLELEQQQLIGKVARYAELLDRNLVWMPSAPPVDGSTLKITLRGMQELADPKWMDALTGLRQGFLEHPVRGSALILLVLLLLLGRRRMRLELARVAPMMGNVIRDSFRFTLKAFLITLLLAAPWPLLLAGVGWFMMIGSGHVGDTVAESLQLISALLLLLQLSRYLFIPNGLAEVHFQWRKNTVQILRRNLRWVLPTVTSMVFLIGLTEYQPDAFYRDNLGRIATILLIVLAGIFAHRVLNSHTGALRHARGFHLYWHHLALGLCLFLIALSLLGYHYTALRLIDLIYLSAWVGVGMLLLYHLANRWLLVAERRLALVRARARRQARQESRDIREAAEAAGESVYEAPDLEEVELDEINEQTRRLLRLGVVLFSAIGLFLIWSQLTPAFGRLDEWVLWEHVVTQGDKQMMAPVTPWDLLVALLVIVLTLVAGANLPGLLEIAVLQPLSVKPDSRYAVTNITLYLIYTAGFLLTVNMLGMRWGDVQWLVAAMGVGIGFGLQEIFANFISGIMILFERPIRIGDTVTVGEYSGIVSRIRIRATTITDFDNKELVIPNKSFVTDPLINWTLSDPITRVVINVGIAYGSDTLKAHKIMTGVIKAHPEVLDEPKPTVFFTGFGDSSLDFQIRVFVSERIKRMPLVHDIHMALDQALSQAGIEIPFPQRDLHLRSVDPDVVFRGQKTEDRRQRTEDRG